MDLPIDIRNRIEAQGSGLDQKELRAFSKQLTERYKENRGQGSRIVSRRLETFCYAVVRMPATFGAVSASIEYMKEFSNEELYSALDLGAGTGAASLALSYLYPEIRKYTLIEREASMIDFSKTVLEDISSRTEYIKADIYSMDEYPKADIVIASYAFNELSDEKRAEVLLKAYNAANKILIIVEPGTKEGYRQIRNSRNMLIDKGANIIAPCPGNCSCQLTEDDWCHFTERVSRTKLQKQIKGTDVPFEDEKFSYIAVSKNEAEHAERRVIRHPVINPGRIALKLCSKNGIEDINVTKKNPDFKKARKSDCGDSF